MKNLIISFAYFLESSQTYYSIKHLAYQFLEDVTFKYKKYFDFFMIFLVLSTIAILIYEVNHPQLAILNDFEIFAIIIFIIEWLGRLWTVTHIHKTIIEDYEKAEFLNQPYSLKKSLLKITKEKFAFIFSPMSIIDLLAILPAYRPLRILRILMIFRLFKLLRYTSSINEFSQVFIEKRFEFFTLALLFFIAVIFGSTIIFIYEGAGINDNIHSYFDAVYWSVITITTVGFGDISPVTTPGRVATLLLVVGGIGVIAFFTSIVTTALQEKLRTIKEEKAVGEANSMKNFIIICGFGRMGKVLASQLDASGEKFLIVDNDEKQFQDSKYFNYTTIKGDASSVALLQNLGVENKAKAVIALSNSDPVNLAIILTARSLNPKINIISRANMRNIEKKMYLAGADKVILTTDITALVASEYVGQPVAFDAIDDILLNDKHAVMEEIEIPENSNFIGNPLTTMNFDSYNLTLIGIINKTDPNNDKFIFNPDKATHILKAQDTLIVIGYIDAILQFKSNILSKKSKLFKTKVR
jgi:voltage-gated potassium channel